MAFPPPHIHHPQTTHTNTIILLHGRGSDGPEFADELFSSSPSPPQPQPAQHPEEEEKEKTNLATHLPQTRWVFPTTKTRWDTRFQEESPAWFDIYSLTDIEARSELQVDGLRESVDHVLRILEAEVALLDGDARRVVLGGMSMGMATALWALLGLRSRVSPTSNSSSRAGGRLDLGGFLGFCGWFPFAGVAERLLGSGCARGQVRELVSTVLGNVADSNNSSSSVPYATIPVLLLHGTDDAFVSVDLGRQAARILEMSGMSIQWHEYDGADNDGHWLKEPEGFDRILEFVGGIFSL